MYFRYAFRELIRGRHPDDPDWWVRSSNHHELKHVLGDATRWRGSPSEQRSLASILIACPLDELDRKSCFPDWLGHIGLVLWHTESAERETRMLTNFLVPEFLMIIGSKSDPPAELPALLEPNSRPLSWQDLEAVQIALMKRNTGAR